MLKQILTIAGSDSGAGAGIQADLKTFSALGTYGLSVITAITAQNTLGVKQFEEVSLNLIVSQLDAILEDFDVDTIKTGMLPSSDIIDLISNKLKKIKIPLIVDTVMIAKGGHSLVKNSAVDSMINNLIPIATLITPNIDEAETILSKKITNIEQMKSAANDLLNLGPKAVLLKGGHLKGDLSVDILFDGKNFFEYASKRIYSENTHGTGCTLASAIAANIGKGAPLEKAVKLAKDYVYNAIIYSKTKKIGHGHGPLDHFYKFR